MNMYYCYKKLKHNKTKVYFRLKTNQVFKSNLFFQKFIVLGNKTSSLLILIQVINEVKKVEYI